MSLSLGCKFLPLALLAALLAAPFADAKDEDGAVVTRFLESVELGEGQVADQLIVFPLIAKQAPERLGLQPSTWAKKVGYDEVEFPRRRFDLAVANNETEPLLILGGTVLGGGLRDRVVPGDVLLAAGERQEIESIAAAPAADQRKSALPFRLGSALAPPYIRERSSFSPTNTLVPNFASHFLEFRNPGDTRRSLSAINASEALNKLCIPCHESLSVFPTAQGGRVVGMVTAVRGRIRSLELFGDNRLLKAWFEPLLKSHTFAAAAIALRAEKLRLPVPGGGDAAKALAETREEAVKLLASLRKARFRDDKAPRGSQGQHLLLRTGGGTRGTALALDDRLVHLAVFPHDPFEHALFGRPLENPDAEAGGGDGTPALERKGRQGRLTEYERRLLERMRRNRSGRGLGNVGRR